MFQKVVSVLSGATICGEAVSSRAPLNPKGSLWRLLTRCALKNVNGTILLPTLIQSRENAGCLLSAYGYFAYSAMTTFLVFSQLGDLGG